MLFRDIHQLINIPTHHILNSSGLVQPCGRAIIWFSELKILNQIGSLPVYLGDITEPLPNNTGIVFSGALDLAALCMI